LYSSPSWFAPPSEAPSRRSCLRRRRRPRRRRRRRCVLSLSWSSLSGVVPIN
jgi:hypothetical protein